MHCISWVGKNMQSPLGINAIYISGLYPDGGGGGGGSFYGEVDLLVGFGGVSPQL